MRGAAASLRGRPRRRTGALAWAVCGLVIASPLVGKAIAQDSETDGPHVLVATTGNFSELRKAVPISKKSGKKPRVVMSMGPDGLPSLDNGDRLKSTAEVEVTTDCTEKGVRCVGRPYNFNPIVQVRIVLASGPGVTGGEGSVDLGVERLKCRQKSPDREHHCVITFTDASLDVPNRGALPCSPGSCHLNMVVDAHNRKAKKRKKRGKNFKLIIGEDEPDGTVRPDKGRLNAIRFAPGNQPPITPLVSPTPLVTSIPIVKAQDTVVYSQKLNSLERKEQLAVNGLMFTSIDHLTYNVLIRSRLILAESPTDATPGKEVKQFTEPKGEIAEANGYNCTQRNPQCVTNKVGVISMRKNADDNQGDPIPLYANLVVDTAKPGSTAPAGDAVTILPGGAIAVTRYPAHLKG